MTYSGGNDERGGRERHERASRLGNGGGKDLLGTGAVDAAVGEPAKEEAHAHDEQEVGEDGAEHGGLDDFDLVIPESDDANLW